MFVCRSNAPKRETQPQIHGVSMDVKKLTGQAFGDYAEGECQAALSLLQRECGWWFQRLYDTRSAGAFMPQQPADFFGVAPGGRGFILESKGSAKYGSLMDPGALKALVKPHQALANYLVSRPGGMGLVLFVSASSQVAELWRGPDVRQVYVTPKARLNSSALIANTFVSDFKDLKISIKSLLTKIGELYGNTQQ